MATFLKFFLIVGGGSTLVMVFMQSDSGQRLVKQVGGPAEQLWGEQPVSAAEVVLPLTQAGARPSATGLKFPQPVEELPATRISVVRVSTCGRSGYS